MYRYLVKNEKGWLVVTAQEFRATLPKGETIRLTKKRHWVQVRRWEAYHQGDPNWNHGIARGRRCASADFTV